MKFFYYQRSMTGRWAPQASDTKPTGRLPEGVQTKITQVQELPPEHQNLGIGELEGLYPLSLNQES